MKDSRSGIADAFLASSLAAKQKDASPDPGRFLKDRASVASFQIEEMPISNLPDWKCGQRLTHRTGRFFTVEGISVETNFGPVENWTQPVIVQPEIGILGIVVQKFDGVYKFLMQAKMEPGNTELVQYAATVQATPSNYQRVHGGRPTSYLSYFLEGSRHNVLFDQLLSEHGTWYLRKRNRNMLVEVPPDLEVPLVSDDFTWLTLGQIRQELFQGNRVNMNARTILSGISYNAFDRGKVECSNLDPFRMSLVESHGEGCSDSELSLANSWINDQKSRYDLRVTHIPLQEMEGWVYDSTSIRHEDGNYFSIVGLSIEATTREVSTWSQPMLQPTSNNLVCLICQSQSGVLKFLMQAIVQPGLSDKLELTATVHLSAGDNGLTTSPPPLSEYVDAPDSWIRRDCMQSEDGGRFLGADTRHLVIEVPEDQQVDVPNNYRWMSLGLINRLNCAGYLVNIEARSLIACLL